MKRPAGTSIGNANHTRISLRAAVGPLHPHDTTGAPRLFQAGHHHQVTDVALPLLVLQLRQLLLPTRPTLGPWGPGGRPPRPRMAPFWECAVDVGGVANTMPSNQKSKIYSQK